MKIWDFISYNGVKDLTDNSLRRKIILVNRVNFYLIVIFLYYLTRDLTGIYRLGGQPDFAIFRSGFLILISAVHLFLIRAKHFKLARISMLLILPLLVFYGDTVSLMFRETVSQSRWEGAQHEYFFFPFLPISYSLLSYTMFSIRTERKWIYIFTAISFFMVLTAKPYLDMIIWPHLSDEVQTIVSVYYETGGFMAIIPITLFVFVNAIVFYAFQLADRNQMSLEKTVSELEKANETKNKFFRIIGHDLKGPISIMIQGSQVMEAKLSELNEDQIRSFLNEMNKSSTRGFKLLENLLDWAQTQTGDIKFEPQEVHLRSLVQEVFDLQEKSAKDKNITLVNQIKNGSSLSVDPNMMHTIIRNLVSNGLKYSVKNTSVTVSGEFNGPNYELSVMDQGTGMDQSKVDKLFQLDQIESIPGTQNEIGTGLGLIITKEFIRRHGGSIHVDSQDHKGSTFTVSLPVSTN